MPIPNAPLSRTSVPDQVFALLREAILSGRYRPGERLPPQRALAAELAVNMASIREALKRLQQLRLVEVRHGDATRVLDWRRSGGLEALVLADGFDPSFARDLFEARRLLLVEAARLAAERRSEEQARPLRELAGSLAAAADAGGPPRPGGPQDAPAVGRAPAWNAGQGVAAGRGLRRSEGRP